MKATRYILLVLLSATLSYGSTMFGLCRISINGNLLLYASNDYFPQKGGDSYRKIREFRQEKKYDVVVIGSSRAYHGYSPDVFVKSGYSMFNLGTSAQSIENTRLLIDHYLDSSNTKLLIVDIFWGSFWNSFESSADLVTNADDPEAAFDIALNANDARAFNLLVARSFCHAATPVPPLPDYAGKGFSVRTDSLAPALREKMKTFRQPAKSNFVIAEKAVRAFEGILSDCRQRHLRLVLVNGPAGAFYPRQNHAMLMAAIRPLIAAYKIPFYDFSTDFHLDPVNHFYDGPHVNLAGATLFTQALVERLEGDNLLPAKKTVTKSPAS